MRNIFTILLITMLTVSCSTDDDGNEVRIRLANNSQFTYENILVNTSTGTVDFESIESGANTEYKTFSKAYRYAFISVDINDTTYTFQPIDYVGETPLATGNYTYEVSAVEFEGDIYELDIRLVED